jgi:hypothetical protein
VNNVCGTSCPTDGATAGCAFGFRSSRGCAESLWVRK